MTTMDRISSHFRRTRKGAAVPAPIPVAAPSPTPAAPDGRLPTPSYETASLLSTTSSTAPPTPRSKSPLRRLISRASQKRARSPATTTFPLPTSPVVANHAGTTDTDMTSPVKDATAQISNGDHGPQDFAVKPPPRVPGFLTLSESGMSPARGGCVSRD
jgi:hypothetical protein